MKQFPINPLQARIALELKHARPLIGCRFDPSGRFLFVSSEDSTLQRFDLVTGQKTAFVGHSSWVRGMAFSPARSSAIPLAASPCAGLVGGLGVASLPPPNPFTVISADYHGNAIWWDGTAESPKPVRTVAAHLGWVRAVAVSPDGKTLATCGNDHLVKLWSVADGRPLATLEGHLCHVYNVAFHPNGSRLVSADLKGVVKDWEWATGKLVRELDAKVFHKYDTGFAADIGGLRGLTFSADGASLACTGITNVSNAFAGVGNPLVVAFDWKDGKAKQYKPKDAFQGTGWGVGHLSTGLVAAGGAAQGKMWFWKPDEANSFHAIDVAGNARDMAVHPDGTAVAVATATGTAYVYTLSPFTPVPPSPKKEAVIPKKA